ncbi:TIGR04255 family protein [Sinorhizobium americanum]|uniref:TIGR04255 family protein n=1 Tax=Sinorhizobium americanum TaxID=194963 RepID=UPI0004D75097|nr:TIGR04255 family protein [Sinorhizobium americanum]
MRVKAEFSAASYLYVNTPYIYGTLKFIAHYPTLRRTLHCYNFTLKELGGGMSKAENFDPLHGEHVQHVPLRNAPLVRVLSQVRFPDVTVAPDRNFVAAFQQAIRRRYPLVREEATPNIAFGPGGVSVTTNAIWRFLDAASVWRVSLTPTFLSLETKEYVSGEDFVRRFRALLTDLGETIAPSHVTRIGIRYVDQVDVTQDLIIEDLLHPHMNEITGALKGVRHMISELEAETAEGGVLARWGHLPGNGSHDPDMMPPRQHPTWFLDVDSFASYESNLLEYEVDEIANITTSLSKRAYDFFRWCVNDRFLETFGKDAQ